MHPISVFIPILEIACDGRLLLIVFCSISFDSLSCKLLDILMQSDINMLRQTCRLCALYNQLPGEYVEIYTGMQKFNSTQIFIHVIRFPSYYNSPY